MHKQCKTRQAAVQGGLTLLACVGAQAQAPDADLVACLKWPPRQSMHGSGEFAPERGQDLGVGNTLVEMSFTAPDREPEVRVLYNSVNRARRDEVVDHARKYRLPCLTAGQRYVHRQAFNFTWTQRAPSKFPQRTSLQPLLAAMPNLDARPVSFDLDAMGCPFQLAWRLGQPPAFAHEVTEIGAANAARAPLIEWLGQLVMDIPRVDFEHLLNNRMTVDVPCGTIKLG